MICPPSDDIARAFGVAGTVPLAVARGQGVTFRVGHLAIKQCEDVEQAEWLGLVLEGVEERGFRVAHPVRATTGNFVVEGWSATRWIDGTYAMEGRWREAIEACDAFHRAVRKVPWSPVLERLDNPFVKADKAVWAEVPLEDVYLGPTGERLRRLLRPVTLPSQLVHGDPSEGNILFVQNQAPGIIDIAPYWHPAGYAVAVLVADGIAWSGAPLDLLASMGGRPEMKQLLARAVLFRLYVGFLFRDGEVGAEARARAYAPVIDAIERWPG